MKCLVMLIVTAILCQAVLGERLIRKRRGGYFDRPRYVRPTSSQYLIHPPWWKDLNQETTTKSNPYRPFGVFGIDRGGSDEDSDEENPPTTLKNIYSGWSRPWSNPKPTTSTVPPVVVPNIGELTAACIQSCPMSTKYYPVCGNNNVTYQNSELLRCHQNCGVGVYLVKYDACSAYESSTTTQQSINREILVACLRKCPYDPSFNPVCGSNNVTYENPTRLNCENKCGINVQIVKLCPCEESQVATTTAKTLTKAEQISNCMRSCSVTAEYSPVCGSDNVTYTNRGRLECAQNCGSDVQIKRLTSCIAPFTAEEIANQLTTSTTALPYINENAKNNTNVTNSNNLGNNLNGTSNSNNGTKEKGENKMNDGSINNSSITGVNLGSVGSNDNTANNANNSNNGTVQSNNNINIENNDTSGNLNKVMACMQTCALTSEYNPICGSDNITYMNPGRLLCAQFCGIDVKVIKFAPCTSKSITNNLCISQSMPDGSATFTNTPVTGTTSSPIQSCMEACPASTVYKPVCGSNNVTYKNKEVLLCASRCGVAVSYASEAECPLKPIEVSPQVWNSSNKPTTPAEIKLCTDQCSVELKYEPVCGSDDVTYNNTAHLICTRQCGLEVRVKNLSPCFDPNGIPKPTTDKTQVTPGPGNLNFTISNEVLGSIWSEVTTPSDEDFELDQRVQDS